MALFLLLNSSELGLIFGSDYFSILALVLSALYFFYKAIVSRNIIFSNGIKLFLVFYCCSMIFSLMGDQDAKSENKLLEFCLIMPALALAAIYFSKQGDDSVLMRALSVTLLYNILMAGIFFSRILTSGVEVVARAGALDGAYHRSGRLLAMSFAPFASTGRKRGAFGLPFWGLIAGFLVCVLSASRGGILAGGVGAGLILAASVRASRRSTGKAVLLTFSALVLFGLCLAYVESPATVMIYEKLQYAAQRFMSLANPDSGAYNRLVMWRESFSAFIDSGKWFTGIGLGQFASETGLNQWRHPHNIFIEVLTETGLIGISLFIAIITVAMRENTFAVNIMIVLLLMQAFFGGDITDNRHLIFTLLLRTR